jgi:hypothetical protein
VDFQSFSFSPDKMANYLKSFVYSLLRRNGDPTQPLEPHLPTVGDVLRVKGLLGAPKPKLPLEIIDVIIDFAEYWPHITARMKEELLVYGSSDEENVECLRTSPLCYDMVGCISLELKIPRIYTFLS